MLLDKKSSVKLTTNQLVPAVAIVNSDGEQVSSFSGSGGGIGTSIVTVSNTNSNPVPINDAASSLTVDGKAYRVAVAITRPSNTTQYTAGDVIGVADSGTPANAGSAIINLSGIGPSGGYVLIQSVRMLIGITSVTSGISGFRLHLYTSSPAAALDNAAFDLTSVDVDKYAGYIDLPTPQDLGSIIYTQTDYPGTLIKLGTGSTSLFAELETRGTFTPASGTVFNLRVMTLEAGL